MIEKLSQTPRRPFLFGGIVLVIVMIATASPALSQDDSETSVADAARAARAKHDQASPAAPTKHAPFTAARLLAWYLAGIPAADLVSDLKVNGIAFPPDDAHLTPLKDSQLPNEILAILSSVPSHPDSSVDAPIPQPLLSASQAFTSKNYANARKSLEPLVQQSSSADLYAALGNLQALSNDLPAAQSSFEHAVQCDPALVYPHIRLAGIYYKLENSSQASAEAKKALQLQPGNAEARRYLSLSLSMNLHSKDPAASLTNEPEDLTDLGLKDGDNQQAKDLNNAGIALTHQGQFQAAEAKFKAAIELEPKVALWYYNLGFNYGKWGGHNVLQEDAYRKAKELAPNNLAVRQNLGAFYCHNHVYNQAILEFSQILKMDPDWNMARPCLYISLYNIGRKNEAAQVLVEYRHWNQTHGVPDDSDEIEVHEPRIDDPRGKVSL